MEGMAAVESLSPTEREDRRSRMQRRCDDYVVFGDKKENVEVTLTEKSRRERLHQKPGRWLQGKR